MQTCGLTLFAVAGCTKLPVSLFQETGIGRVMGKMAFKARADRSGPMGISSFEKVFVTDRAESFFFGNKARIGFFVVAIVTALFSIGRVHREVPLGCLLLLLLGSLSFSLKSILVIVFTILFWRRQTGYAIKNGRRHFVHCKWIAPVDKYAHTYDKNVYIPFVHQNSKPANLPHYFFPV
jgi:hypothetical protein